MAAERSFALQQTPRKRIAGQARAPATNHPHPEIAPVVQRF